MRRKRSYFDKRPLFREESFSRRRDFYREEKVFLDKKTSMRRSYEKKLLL